MPNFTLQDFLKAAIPLIAGGVSAYSRPAARGIEGATSALMAINERDQRHKELEQEMALRASEGERRGRVLSLQEQEAQGVLEDRGSKRKGQQGMLDALGATIAQLTGETQAPGAFGGGGSLSPETIDRQTEAREVAPDVTTVQSMMTPEAAGAALEYLAKARQGARDRTEARGKEERAAGRETAQFEKTLGVRKQEAASQEAYWKQLGAARTEEAGARKTAAEKGGKGTDEKKVAVIDPGKLADEIAKATDNLEKATALKNPVQMDLWRRKLQELQVQYTQMTGANTPGGWMAAKLGQRGQ